MVTLDSFDDEFQKKFRFITKSDGKNEGPPTVLEVHGNVNFFNNNLENVETFNQGNQSEAKTNKQNKKNDKSEKNLPEKMEELPAEDFLLALTVTLLSYGEYQSVSNFYDYLLTEKYRFVLTGESEQNPEKNNQEKTESPKVLKKQSPRAVDIFGRGFEQRLRSIDAQYDEQVINLNGIMQRIRVVKFKTPQHYFNMWNLWRNEYPQFLSEIKPELLFLIQFGDYYTRILAARSLGEIACTSVIKTTSEYLNQFARSRDVQLRYNVGYILSAIIANDRKNQQYIFELLEKWLQRDWRSRWTVAASISRIYKFDIKASIRILTQITEISESLSRDKRTTEQQFQLNPLTMIWHSASYIFLDGHITEILDMLHLWLVTKNRNKQALPDIARELYLDIMQSYFDIRANSIVSNPEGKKNKNEEHLSDVNPISNSEDKERNTDAKNASPAVSSDAKPNPNNSDSEFDLNPEKQDVPANEKSEPESKEQSLESPSGEDKSKDFAPEKNDGPSSVEEPSLVEKQDTSSNEVQSEFQIHENSTTIGNTYIHTTSSSQEKDKTLEYTEEKSIDDIINRIDINSVNKVLWKVLSEECKSKKDGKGTYTRIIVDLTLESLRRGWAKSLANPWFDPDRKPPYKRMQDIIHKWLELSMEDDFGHIQDPLYVILMECYVRLSVDIRDAKLKDKLQKWYIDQNEKDLYQYSFIKEVLDAMNHVSNQITTTESGG